MTSTVSSPATVPSTDGQAAWSMTEAKYCAAPAGVRSTTRLALASAEVSSSLRYLTRREFTAPAVAPPASTGSAGSEAPVPRFAVLPRADAVPRAPFVATSGNAGPSFYTVLKKGQRYEFYWMYYFGGKEQLGRLDMPQEAPGQLRLTFQHDPLLSNGAATLTFDDKTIPALNYREDNGAAEIGVQGTVPLLARFSADRKTITMEPLNQAVAQMPHPATGAGTTAPPATSSLPTIAASVPGALVPPVRVTVIIDAGHGGSERGAALSDNLTEKDVTLSFARTLQRLLQSRGVSATLLRDSDVNLTLEQRAISANGSRAQFYISIHATSMGTGTKIYTSLLPPRSQENRGPFLPWGSAQSSYAAVSQNLAASLTAELIRNSLSARSLSAPLPPLNHIACAAIAAEIAPSGTDITQLNSAAYQEQVANALSAGIVAAQKSQVTQ